MKNQPLLPGLRAGQTALRLCRLGREGREDQSSYRLRKSEKVVALPQKRRKGSALDANSLSNDHRR
jgi:hypothetical protein